MLNKVICKINYLIQPKRIINEYSNLKQKSKGLNMSGWKGDLLGVVQEV